MKLRNFILGAIAALAVAGSMTTLTWATETPAPEPRTIQPEPRTIQPEPHTSQSEDAPAETSDEASLPAPTFSSESVTSDSGAFWFGKNLLFAAQNGTVNQTARGLLIAAGKDLQVNSKSEYAFIAGNVVTFDAATEKDLFAAGNAVFISKEAQVGRDVFVGASSLTLEADIPGDVSVAAAKVNFKDVTIKGNVNLDAGYITFQGKIKIEGALSYNDDAEIFGLTNVEYAKLETYTPETHTITAGELWLSKMMSATGLFCTIAIILLVFPNTKKRIAEDATAQRFGTDLIYGLIFVIVVPLLSILFLMSFFAISTSIFLIGAYCLIFYLAKAFTGAWLGHIIVEKLCHCTLPMMAEALIGILILTCAGMIPGLGLLVSAFALILGAGLIISCLRSGDKKTPEEKHVYYAAEETSSSSSVAKNPFKKSTKSAAKSSSRAKNSTVKSATSKKSTPKTKTPKTKSKQ